MTAKKQKFLERKEQTRTGGGPPPASEPPSADDIAVWLPHEFTVESNQFDSDSQNTIEKRLPKEEKLNQENPTPTPSDNIEIIEAIIEPETIVQTTPTPKIFIQKKLKNKKLGENSSASAAQLISQTEVACRKELHELQMANEKQKLKNLMLKEEVLKYKLEYYKNKLK